MKRSVTLRVNGEDHCLELEPNELLLDVLRDRLGLTGTKEGCSIGVCGTCTVLIDGRRASACLTLAVTAEGKEITTIEGIGAAEELDPIQQAFVDQGAFQCGYCTPGMVLAARELLDLNPNPTDEEIKRGMDGNLCRCTGYYKIVRAVRQAAGTGRAGSGDLNR